MLQKRTWDYITEYGMISEGDRVYVGFSGGPDSVCLLLLLAELGRMHGFSVMAIHVNHNLRGEESDGDQAFAEEFCLERKIPCRCFSYPVEEIARENHMGIEETGRMVRTEAFEVCMQELGEGKIALAHHKRDQAETVLFRMARGSALTGLSGIRPKQGKVIHPLLFAEKEEILEELKNREICFRTDSSNLTDHYTRNSIRNRILPVLEEEVNDKSIAHIAEAAETIAEADAFLKMLASPIRDRCLVKRREKEILVLNDLKMEPVILQKYVLMDALALTVGSRKNYGREHLGRLLDILAGLTGRRASLTGNLEAVKTYEGMVLRQIDSRESEDTASVAIPVEGEGCFNLNGWKIRFELMVEVPSEIPENPFTKWLDYDKIKTGLELRNRQPGDYLVVREDGSRKKLKSYFIDEKIPADIRNTIPLLASGQQIFWVIGYRISEDCKITAQTKKCIKITAQEDKK